MHLGHPFTEHIEGYRYTIRTRTIRPATAAGVMHWLQSQEEFAENHQSVAADEAANRILTRVI